MEVIPVSPIEAVVPDLTQLRWPDPRDDLLSGILGLYDLSSLCSRLCVYVLSDLPLDALNDDFRFECEHNWYNAG